MITNPADPPSLMSFAYPLIRLAVAEALRKHPSGLTPYTDPVRGAGIMTEEVGEVMSEALGLTRSPKLEGARERMICEAAQVAATAIFLIAAHAIESDFIDE